MLSGVETYSINRLIIILIFATSLHSCSSSSSNKESSEEQTDLSFTEFKHFPNKVFLEISMGIELEGVTETLLSKGYEKKYGDDSKYYYNINDSIEVVFPEYDNINEFRILLKSERFLSKREDFKSFLGENASKMSKNRELLIFEYRDIEHPIKLNYFEQEDYIRLKIISL